VPYNPQQNNRIICEAARAMMHDQNLPLSLWAEAANTAVFIQNRCPHKVLDALSEEYISILKNNVWTVVPRPRNKYVDDLFLTGEEDLIAQTKRELSKEFEIKDLGQMHYSLGLEIWQKPGEIFLTQSKYAFDILCRFGMMDCKSMTTQMISKLKKLQDQVTGSDPEDPTVYRQIIGSLMYLVHTRPDICYAVNALSQFMCDPKHIHMIAVKHILRYVRGTIAYGLRCTSSGGVMLHGFTDSDWMGSVVDRKGTSGYCFSLGSAMISWSSRKQGSIAQSTAEAEYIAASTASREAVWLRKLLSKLIQDRAWAHSYTL
jgi:hypothetical protein